jgi:biotin-(acetyl-CoA carboxylase) ligase
VRLLDVGRSGASANVTPLALLAAMLEQIDARRSQGDDELRREHTSTLATLGTRVRVELQAGATLVGMAHDVDDESRLIVVGDDGVRHVVDVGDVVHLRAR